VEVSQGNFPTSGNRGGQTRSRSQGAGRTRRKDRARQGGTTPQFGKTRERFREPAHHLGGSELKKRGHRRRKKGVVILLSWKRDRKLRERTLSLLPGLLQGRGRHTDLRKESAACSSTQNEEKEVQETFPLASNLSGRGALREKKGKKGARRSLEGNE